MKTCLKDDETQRAVDRVKTTFSPATPCVNVGADGYCTGPCQGAICCGCADYKPQTAVTVADGTVTMPALALEHPTCTTTAEAVRFDLAMAKQHGTMSLAYLARAGWRLACEKESVGHGAWLNVCKEMGISADTAGRYIKFYYGTVGEHMRAQGAAHRLVENLTDAMIEEATAGLESKTATGAMIELGIVKRPAGWGGARENAGRKSKDDAEVSAEKAVSEAAVRAELSAEEGRDLVAKLAGWALGADDGFGTLPDGELARAVKTLKQVLARAEEIKAAREVR